MARGEHGTKQVAHDETLRTRGREDDGGSTRSCLTSGYDSSVDGSMTIMVRGVGNVGSAVAHCISSVC